MAVAKSIDPLKENKQEMDSFFKIEFFFLIELKHFLRYFYQDGIFRTIRPKNNFGIFVNDSRFTNFLVRPQQVCYLQL